MFSTGFSHLVSCSIFLYQSPSTSLFMVFDSISFNIDWVLSINHLLMLLSLETSTSITRTRLPILLGKINLVNSVIIFLTQMTLFRWFTFLLRFQTVILIVLTILMLIWMALGIISEMFHGRIYLNLVLLLLLVNFVSGFRLEMMYISLIKNIRSSLIHLHSAACAPAIVQRNHFFRLHQMDKSSDSKSTFRQTTNCWKRVLEAAKLAYANKTKGSITSKKLSSQDFW